MLQFYFLKRWLFAVGLSVSAIAAAQGQCPVAASCTPGRASSQQAAAFGMGILNVTLGGINNSTTGYADGYQDYGCTQQAALARGVSYPVSIRTNANAPENVRVWIDYNNDGQFSPTTELFFSSDNAQQHLGTSLVVPATALLGTPLRLRVAADGATAPVPTPCSTPLYSQTEDYSVVLGVNTQTPVAAFAVGAAGACTGSFAFTDQSARGPSAWRWTFGDGSSSTQQNPTHAYSAPGAYRVQLRVCNANGCDSLALSGAATWYPPLAVAAPCTPATTGYCCGYGITLFGLAGQSQASADGRAGYEDFSCVRRFAVQQGQSYAVQLYTGASPHHVQVYIDYNNNGSFTDPEELVYEVLSASNPGGTIAIAGGGVTGTPLRLRVVADGSGQAMTACTAPALGQVEDYSIVVAPSQCAGLPAVLPRIVASQVCTGFPASLYYPAAAAGASLQWQTSADSLTWSNVPLATNAQYVTPIIGATSVYYRVRLVCGSTTRFSFAYRAVPGGGLCYCRPVVGPSSGCAGLSRLGRVWLPTTPLDIPPGSCATQADDAGRILGLYPASQTATLQQGGTYQLNATVPAQQGLHGWLDFNRNGQFDPSEYLAFTYSGTGSTLAQALFTVPAGAQLGATGLRLRLNIFYTGAPANTYACQPSGNGEALDMLVTIVPANCATAALLGGRVLGPPTYCPNTVPAMTVLYQTPSAALQWQTSPDSLAWTDVAGATSAQLSGPNTRFQDSLYVRVAVRCGTTGPAAYSPAVYIKPDPQLCFCVLPSYVYPGSFEEISSVRVANTPLYVRGSPLSVNRAYLFYPPSVPSNTATLLAGVSYPMVIQPPNSQLTNIMPNVMGWLDTDNNGRFTAAESTLLQTRGSQDTLTTLTVPPKAVPSARSRLRTQTLGNAIFAADVQCTVTGGTEMRDFLVTVAAASPSALPLTAGLIQGMNSTGIVSSCAGQRVRLTVVGYSRGAALQWQQQVGSSGAWQPIAGATDEALTSGVLSGATSFRVEARLGAAGPVWSAPVLVTPSGPCPCTANLRGSSQYYPWGDITMFVVYSKFGHFINRSNSAPPTVNGSVYTDYSLRHDSLHTTLYRGLYHQTQIASASGNYNTPCEVGMWVDYNNNGVFEATERVVANNTSSFQVPATAALGPVRVRIRSRSTGLGTALGAGDACRTLDYNDYGETEDYTFTVADPPAFVAPEITVSGAVAPGSTVQLGTRRALPTGTVVTWEGPAGFVSTQAQPTLTNLTAAQSGYYYLTARTASGTFQLTAARRLQIGSLLANSPAQPTLANTSLYPNPTTGLVMVHFDGVGPAYQRLRVLSSTGQVVLTQPLTARDLGADLPLDLRAQPRGLYLVQLLGPAGLVARKLLLE